MDECCLRNVLSTSFFTFEISVFGIILLFMWNAGSGVCLSFLPSLTFAFELPWHVQNCDFQPSLALYPEDYREELRHTKFLMGTSYIQWGKANTCDHLFLLCAWLGFWHWEGSWWNFTPVPEPSLLSFPISPWRVMMVIAYANECEDQV
jgi:hypothetical protein